MELCTYDKSIHPSIDLLQLFMLALELEKLHTRFHILIKFNRTNNQNEQFYDKKKINFNDDEKHKLSEKL